MAVATMLKERVAIVSSGQDGPSPWLQALVDAGYTCIEAPPDDTGRFEADLAVIDLASAGAALAALRRLRTIRPEVRLMVLGGDSLGDEVHALEVGADDYLVRPPEAEVLVARVHALLRRFAANGTPRSPELRFADLCLDVGGHRVTRGTRELKLTPIEFRLLREFLTHPGLVLAKSVLLERVWGFDASDNDNVVEVYVHQLRRKLEAGAEPRLIQTLRGAGYVLRET